MTQQEFKEIVKWKDSSTIFDYCICLAVIFMGLYFLDLITNGSSENTVDWQSKLIYLMPISMFSVGLLGIYLILIKNNVSTIYSNLPTYEKTEIMKDYFKKVNAIRFEYRNGYTTCYYDTFIKTHLELLVAVDDEKIIFKIKQFRFGIEPIGVTDFGLTYRHTKKFKKYLKKCSRLS